MKLHDILKWILKKQNNAAIFIDFEYWVYTLDKLYRIQPDLDAFMEEVKKTYDIKRLFLFGSFAEPKLRRLSDIMEKYKENIIHVQAAYSKKNYTGFMLLDRLYQDVDSAPKVDTYIIFTGDSYYSSVINYLRNKKKKHIVLYSVAGAIKSSLRNLADEHYEIPDIEKRYYEINRMIIGKLDQLASKNTITYPTFMPTVYAVVNEYNVQESFVREALERLINTGIIEQKQITIGFRERKNVLRVKWDKAAALGLWSYDSDSDEEKNNKSKDNIEKGDI